MKILYLSIFVLCAVFLSHRETNSEDEGKFNEKGHEIAVKMNKSKCFRMMT